MAFADEDPPPAVATERHHITLLPAMEPMLRSFERALAQARRRVMVECYIVRDDEMGALLARVLASAAARGVRTRLLYDPLGSEHTPAAYFERLRAQGVEVRAYRDPPLQALRLLSYPRDHGRTMVVDDEAWTGGAAWGREWLPLARGGAGWHDVCVTVAGPVVEDFAHVFERRWAEAVGETDGPRDIATLDRYRELELLADTPENTCLTYERHRAAIRSARERVWIEHSYFLPAAGMLRDLAQARARGVDVKVLVPGQNDLPAMQHAALGEVQTWLDADLEIYEYLPCVMHSKFALVDRDWCTIGTFNANAASPVLANEVNLVVREPAFVDLLAEVFLRDLRGSLRVTPERVAARPLGEKLRDALTAGVFNAFDTAFGPPED